MRKLLPILLFVVVLTACSSAPADQTVELCGLSFSVPADADVQQGVDEWEKVVTTDDGMIVAIYHDVEPYPLPLDDFVPVDVDGFDEAYMLLDDGLTTFVLEEGLLTWEVTFSHKGDLRPDWQDATIESMRYGD